jgi:hypothetical protein
MCVVLDVAVIVVPMCHPQLVGAHVAGNQPPRIVAVQVVRLLLAQVNARRADKREGGLAQLAPARRIRNAAT